jgi:putrescine:ornithine antiporter
MGDLELHGAPFRIDAAGCQRATRESLTAADATVERRKNMQRARRRNPRRHRAWIAAVAVTLLAALLPLAQATAGTLDRVRQAGKLTLGYRADAKPFSYRDEAGKVAGYSVALCERIAEEVKAELGLPALAVEWTPVTLEDRLRAVQDGKIDLLCGAASASLARMKEVSFSIAIFPGGIGALLRADASTDLRDVLSGKPASGPLWRARPAQILEGKTFSVVAGTTSEKWLAGRIDTFRLTATVAPVDSYDAGVQRVLSRGAHVFFGERAILLDIAARGPSARQLAVLDRQFTYEPIALAFARGDEDFRQVVDRTLSRLYGSKEFADLYAKWFGKPDQEARTFFRWSALPE